MVKNGKRYYNLNYRKMPNQIYTQEIAQCKSTLSLVTLSFNLFTVFVYL